MASMRCALDRVPGGGASARGHESLSYNAFRRQGHPPCRACVALEGLLLSRGIVFVVLTSALCSPSVEAGASLGRLDLRHHSPIEDKGLFSADLPKTLLSGTRRMSHLYLADQIQIRQYTRILLCWIVSIAGGRPSSSKRCHHPFFWFRT